MNHSHLDHIQEVLDSAVRAEYLKGANCLLFQNGREQGYWESGTADEEKGTRFSRDTICRLYSMSKPVTAAAVMLLVEEGKLDLLDDVSGFIPEFAHLQICTGNGKTSSPRPVTIQDLLDMTSGISYGGNSTENEIRTSELIEEIKSRLDGPSPLTTLEIAQRLGRIPLSFEPGTGYQYGLSADVLGAVVEQVTGMKFGEFLTERIFTPLGMCDTAFYVPKEKQARFAQIYQQECGHLVRYTAPNLGISNTMEKAPAYESGGAGLVSTADDCMKFCRMMLGGGTLKGERVLSSGTVFFMRTAHLTQQLQTQFDSRFGYLSGYTYSNLMRVMKDSKEACSFGNNGEYGWDGWTGTYMMIDPGNDMCMTVMMQRADTGTTGIVRRIRNIVYSAI